MENGSVVVGIEETKKIQWHPGFYAGLEFDLRKYREILEFEPEHVLSKKPVQMDMLIIKKRSDVMIDNVIGRIFRKHNVIEYKSPDDELSIDDLYKTIGYACLYKGYGEKVNAISATELTISIFRHSYPSQLMKDLSEIGATVETISDGVYYVGGIINVPLQIVVTGQLSDDTCKALRVLTHNAREEDVKRFITESQEVVVSVDKNNVDAVLQVSVAANDELYRKIRRETAMCEALRELMKDDIEEAVEKAVEKTKIITRFEDGMDIDKIAEKTNVSIAIVNQVLKENGMIPE